MADNRDVKYLNKEFGEFKQNLVEYARNYFPNTQNDFTDASPATMFVEMAAYVGDVLSFYTDYTLKENLLQHAQERKNILDIAQSFGYKPKLSVPANVDLDVYQLVPATNTGGDGSSSHPDWDYAFLIESGMEVQTETGIIFQTTRDVNFRHSSSASPTDVSVYQTNSGTGLPEFYLLKKSVSAIHGESRTQQITVGAPEKFYKARVNDNNVIGINSVSDSDGNTWTEVPFLGQDTVYEENVNNFDFDPLLEVDSVNTPYILSLRKTGRRFITRITPDNKLEMQFGSGTSTESDVTILPNPANVGSHLPNTSNLFDTAFDPENFMVSRTYGQVPSSTTLTVNYTVGKGIESNVAADTITVVNSKTVQQTVSKELVPAVKLGAVNSIAVNNPLAATGGRSEETVEEIRQNSLAYFATQNRVVTREDYIIRAYSMPSRFGGIEKAYITPDQQIIPTSGATVDNPFALNMYVLGYNSQKQLTEASRATKENLRNYLSQYRLLTDAVNIKNGYIINIGIDFDVVVLPGRNSREVILKCIEALKEEFHIDNMAFRQPIIVRDITLLLASVDGVQSVMGVRIDNKWRESEGYSGNRYSITAATRDGVLYPSLDPSVFEIKYPDTDIRGKAVTY